MFRNEFWFDSHKKLKNMWTLSRQMLGHCIVSILVSFALFTSFIYFSFAGISFPFFVWMLLRNPDNYWFVLDFNDRQNNPKHNPTGGWFETFESISSCIVILTYFFFVVWLKFQPNYYSIHPKVVQWSIYKIVLY